MAKKLVPEFSKIETYKKYLTFQSRIYEIFGNVGPGHCFFCLPELDPNSRGREPTEQEYEEVFEALRSIGVKPDLLKEKTNLYYCIYLREIYEAIAELLKESEQ